MQTKLKPEALSALNEVIELAEGMSRLDPNKYSPRFKAVIRKAREALDVITAGIAERPIVVVVEPAAPEEQPEIVICPSDMEAREVFQRCDAQGLEARVAESSPHACQCAEFLEAYQ